MELENKKSKIWGGSKGKDLVGKTFQNLKVISLSNIGKYGKIYLCECVCGNSKEYRGSALTSGKVSGCGCGIGKANLGKRHSENATSKVGEKYSKLTIISIEEDKSNGGYKHICQCECGNITKQIYSDMKRGKVLSCGCHQKEMASLTGSSIGINNAKRPHNWYFILNEKKILCRSGYEVIYANFLMENGINFKYEPKQFKLGNGVRYLPDFQIDDTFVEVKGYLSDRSKIKMKKFSENFSLQVLYWDDLVEGCHLPFKSYSSFFKKAKSMNIQVEDYLADRLYK
jgi:hypothetical protein